MATAIVVIGPSSCGTSLVSAIDIINKMPPLKPERPEDAAADARRDAGLSRQLNVARSEQLHDPNRGGSTGCANWCRQEQMVTFQQGLPITMSDSTICRWLRDPVPKRQTGNKQFESIRGMDQFHMALCLHACPCAQLLGESCGFCDFHCLFGPSHFFLFQLQTRCTFTSTMKLGVSSLATKFPNA
jgi:hypothetical protein